VKRVLRLPTASLFVQVLALMGVSLLIAWVVNLLVVFNLPPPMPDFYRVSEVTQAAEGHMGAPSAQHRPLEAHLDDKPPWMAPPWSQDVAVGLGPSPFKNDLAAKSGINVNNIIIWSNQGRFADRRAYRLVLNELAKDGHARGERFLFAPFKIGIHRQDGQWLIITPQPSLKPTAWQLSTMLWLLLSTLVVSPIAYLFARRMAAPIALFAAAADRLGRDPGAPPLTTGGPAEIAVAVRAFNDMQERLARYVEDRTAMIGAVAHDLRTPLTRLRFRLEAAPEDVRVKMAADIAEMEAMISGTLAFVRDATQPAARARLELSSLLESLADEMSETGLQVTVDQSDKVIVDGDPVALRRLFNNLLENAVKFGCEAHVRVYPQSGMAVVEIDDNGPGLPDAALERVFEPFYRHEGSRSRKTGGIGLGLAVVRTVARAHGGDAVLVNRKAGGMTARVQLPV
jgi:two-component system OmpR family sensor kinase